MARTTKTATVVKDGVDGLVKKTRKAINSGLDSAQESFEGGVDRVDRGYREAMARVRSRAERVSHHLQGQVDGTRKALLVRFNRGRKTVSRLQRDAGKYAKEHPGKILLAVAGLGLFLGLVASPRRRVSAA